MNNPFNVLPSYIKETPKFSKFLELVSGYLISGALQTEMFKDAFLLQDSPRFITSSLAKQMSVEVDVPVVNGNPDWNAYYQSLFYAVRSKSFNAFFKGTLAELNNSNTLNSVCKMSVLDFSIASDQSIKQPMSVLYSIMGYSNYLTSSIVKSYLVPNITGVGSITYLVYGGEQVFGYDLDEISGKRFNPDTGLEETLSEGTYAISNALISTLGSGYQVGDEVEATVGEQTVKFRITDLSEYALLVVVNPSQRFSVNPSAEGVSVTGGSGSGMKINIVGGSGHGYFIRGWDDGKFYTIL